jgi:hypothetical protein
MDLLVTQPSLNKMILEAMVDGKMYWLMLHRGDETKLPLFRRKFRWITNLKD